MQIKIQGIEAQKTKEKEYANLKRHATDNAVNVKEKVYLINMTKENKLTADFNETSRTVLRKRRIQNNDSGQKLRRNKVHLKQIEGQ